MPQLNTDSMIDGLEYLSSKLVIGLPKNFEGEGEETLPLPACSLQCFEYSFSIFICYLFYCYVNIVIKS